MNAWASLFDELRTRAVSAGTCPRRVDRAIELVGSGRLSAKVREYGTTARTCGCPDRQQNWRKVRLCKHCLALAMRQQIMRELMEEEDAGSQKPKT